MAYLFNNPRQAIFIKQPQRLVSQISSCSIDVIFTTKIQSKWAKISKTGSQHTFKWNNWVSKLRIQQMSILWLICGQSTINRMSGIWLYLIRITSSHKFIMFARRDDGKCDRASWSGCCRPDQHDARFGTWMFRVIPFRTFSGDWHHIARSDVTLNGPTDCTGYTRSINARLPSGEAGDLPKTRPWFSFLVDVLTDGHWPRVACPIYTVPLSAAFNRPPSFTASPRRRSCHSDRC